MQGLYFDSRKDKALIQVTEQDGRLHRRTIREEHISIVSEPETRYFRQWQGKGHCLGNLRLIE